MFTWRRQRRPPRTPRTARGRSTSRRAAGRHGAVTAAICPGCALAAHSVRSSLLIWTPTLWIELPRTSPISSHHSASAAAVGCVIGALREDRRARVFAMEESSVRRRSYLAMKEFIGVPTLRTWIPLVRSDIIDFDAHAADLDSPCPQPTPGPSSLGDERIHRCVGMPRGLLTLSLHMPAAQLPRRGPPA